MTSRIRITRATTGSALAALAVALGACGDDEEEPATPTTTAKASEECEEVPAAEPKDVKLKEPTEQVKPGEKITATVETNCGDFSFVLDTKNSPKTTSSFVHLVDEGLYDGTPFHRVESGFVIQGGDPAGDGTGGPGYSVVEEPPANTTYTRGTVAMAKTGLDPAGSSGSQFFVVTGADAGLPPDYAILGELTGDEEAVDRIDAQAFAEGGPPVVPVTIERITLERG